MHQLRSGLFALAALALTASLAAQSTPPASDQAYGSDAKKITVTGCLERAAATGTPTGTSGTAAAPADATKFVLNNVTTGASASETAGTSGTAAATSYRLDAEDSKLEGHVGHKIEITGTVEQPMAGAPARSTGAAAPKLKVDQVKMIAASCTP